MAADELATHADALAEWRHRLTRIFETVFHPKPDLKISEWAETERVLSREGGAAEQGPWRNDRVPYLVEIMDAICDPDVTEVTVKKSARVGYTEGVIGNAIGYFIQHDPSPILVVQPTQGDAEDWSKTQLSSMIRVCPSLATKVADAKSRDSNNTILNKDFEGGYIKIRGAHAPGNFRRISARVVAFDEVTAFPPTDDGDAIALGTSRADTFPDRKILKGSTPGIKGFCRITKEFERTDQRYYHVPCPHCSHSQVLRWGGPNTPYGIKWERVVRCKSCNHELDGNAEECPSCSNRDFAVEHDPDTAHYVCESCHCVIEEHEKPAMVRRGQWIPKKPGAPVRGYHINALVSLISDKARWSNLVREWIEAQKDPEKLQVFVNNVLGEEWEERGQKVTTEGLAARAERYEDADGEVVDVPEGVGVLTASVDVQGDRLEFLVRGWGAGEESWLVAHHRIYGDPERPDVWARLEALRTRIYTQQHGHRLRIAACFIDSRYLKDAVYRYVHRREKQGVYAIQGATSLTAPPLSRASKANRDGLKLFTVGGHALKDVLFKRLQIGRPGPGYIHFCAMDPDRFNGADAEYYAQLGAEKLVARKKAGRVMRREYVKIRERNEAIDLEVYALGALHALGAGVRRNLAAYAAQLGRPADEDRPVGVGRPRSARRVRSRGVAA